METVICGHEVYRDVSELALARSLADWRACELTIRVTHTYTTSYVYICIYIHICICANTRTNACSQTIVDTNTCIRTYVRDTRTYIEKRIQTPRNRW